MCARRTEYVAKVDDQVEGNAELTSMLHARRALRLVHGWIEPRQPIIHTGDLPSADELAAELERFLADRRTDDHRRDDDRRGDDWRGEDRRGRR
jgi:hypothetical protein